MKEGHFIENSPNMYVSEKLEDLYERFTCSYSSKNIFIYKKTQQAFAVTFLENFGEIIEPLSGFTVYFCIEEFIYRIIKK